MERNICKRLDVNMRKEKFDNFRVRCVKWDFPLSRKWEKLTRKGKFHFQVCDHHVSDLLQKSNTATFESPNQQNLLFRFNWPH